LDLLDVDVAQAIARKGLKMLGCLQQPLEHGVGVHLKDSGDRPNAKAFG
jgi:hypothetical protein